jgi:hypothetical protein
MRNEVQRKEQITVPIDRDLREEIERIAAAECRSMSGQIRHRILDALVERGGRGRQVQQRAGA